MAITCPPKVITDRVVLCRRPTHPLGKWVLWSHQVLRVYWVPPGESRTVLGGLLGVSILISMLVMFMFWHTSPVCRQQDACNDLCSDSQKCGTSVSTYSNMSVNLLHRNDSSSFDAWPSCLQSAQDWQKKPGNVCCSTSASLLELSSQHSPIYDLYRISIDKRLTLLSIFLGCDSSR